MGSLVRTIQNHSNMERLFDIIPIFPIVCSAKAHDLDAKTMLEKRRGYAFCCVELQHSEMFLVLNTPASFLQSVTCRWNRFLGPDDPQK